MYKVYYRPDKSNIVYPNTKGKESIWVVEVGYSRPWQDYDSGSLVRDVFVLHYVKSGKSMYNGMAVEGPCLLIMSPRQPQRYVVDSDSPEYEQYWIKIAGPSAMALMREAGIPTNDAVVKCDYIDKAFEILESLMSSDTYKGVDDRYTMLSALFSLFALHSGSLQETATNRKISKYTQIMLDYIHSNYASQITEHDLSELVHLSTNYAHRLFTSDMGITPINYLNHYRILCAQKLLRETDLTISKIAESVGFSTGDYFCRVFKKLYHHHSPTDYRRRVTRDHSREVQYINKKNK